MKNLHDKCKQNCCTFGAQHHRLLFGYGNNIDPKIVFIGESPSIKGEKEENVCPFDLKSKPVFDEILKLFNTTREQSYTTNLVKCSIPYQRIGDIDKCLPVLLEELDIINAQLNIVLSKKISQVLFPNARFPTHLYFQNRAFILYYHPMYVIYGKISVDEYINNLKNLYSEVKLLAQRNLYDYNII